MIANDLDDLDVPRSGAVVRKDGPATTNVDALRVGGEDQNPKDRLEVVSSRKEGIHGIGSHRFDVVGP